MEQRTATEREEEYPVMDRKELCSRFETLIHNYEHMGELPHETARRVREWSKDPKLAEQFPAYISFWSEYLLTLSRLVRSEGQELQAVDPDMLCYLEERKAAMEKVQRRNALKELLEENRRKGFPSEIGALVRWCKERVGEDYAREFCAAFGITGDEC